MARYYRVAQKGYSYLVCVIPHSGCFWVGVGSSHNLGKTFWEPLSWASERVLHLICDLHACMCYHSIILFQGSKRAPDSRNFVNVLIRKANRRKTIVFNFALAIRPHLMRFLIGDEPRGRWLTALDNLGGIEKFELALVFLCSSISFRFDNMFRWINISTSFCEFYEQHECMMQKWREVLQLERTKSAFLYWQKRRPSRLSLVATLPESLSFRSVVGCGFPKFDMF